MIKCGTFKTDKQNGISEGMRNNMNKDRESAKQKIIIYGWVNDNSSNWFFSENKKEFQDLCLMLKCEAMKVNADVKIKGNYPSVGDIVHGQLDNKYLIGKVIEL